MNKLFENWRDFRKDILSEATPDIIDYSPELHTRIKPAGSLTVKELSIARQVLSLVFPPLAIPEAVEAYEQFDKNPSLANAGSTALAMLATVPFIAVPAKAAKAGVAVNAITQAEKLKAAKQVISSAKKTSKAMKDTPQYQQLALKIDDEIFKVKKHIRDLAARVVGDRSLRFSHFTPPLPGGIQDISSLYNIAKKLGTTWKGTSWRGESYKNVTDLFNRLGLSTREKIKLQKILSDRKEGWIKLQINSALKPNPAPGKDKFLSFTKDKVSALRFAEKEGKAIANNVKVLYKTTGEEMIDVANTIKKGDPNLTKNKIIGMNTDYGGVIRQDPDHLNLLLDMESELLSAGDVLIQEIWIKILN